MCCNINPQRLHLSLREGDVVLTEKIDYCIKNWTKPANQNRPKSISSENMELSAHA